jgi:hypothetical protein
MYGKNGKGAFSILFSVLSFRLQLWRRSLSFAGLLLGERSVPPGASGTGVLLPYC